MKYIAVDERTRERAVQLFSAMAHPTRHQIVELLTAGELSVGQIASRLNLSQSGTSQHLAILARAGVLVTSSKGTSRLYRLRGPRIEQILQLIKEFCHVHSLYGTGEEEL